MKARSSFSGGLRLGVKRSAESIVFQVTDTRIGIRGEDQDRIFEPFVQVENGITRRHGGSGLDLAVAGIWRGSWAAI